MPYALNYDTPIPRPVKRRRLMTGADMTPYHDKQPQQGNDMETEFPDEVLPEDPYDAPQPAVPEHEIRTSDRGELIDRIKRGQRPLWVPKPGLQALYAEEESLRRDGSRKQGQQEQPQESRSRWSPTSPTEEDPFYQPWTISDGLGEQVSQQDSPRPRSAFHAGDFGGTYSLRNTSLRNIGDDLFVNEPLPTQSTSPPTWLMSTTSASVGQSFSHSRVSNSPAMASFGRQRAPSLGSSLSSSFVMRTPTSPLAHAVTASTYDLAPAELSFYSAADRQSRRRTMPPNSFHSLRMSPLEIPMTYLNEDSPHSVLRRESTMSHQTHQPRRSLSSFTVQSSIGSHTPPPRSRRPSIVSETSSRRRTSMVGSFEESILRGRMSSPPSKPFEFIAQIGVMGRGNCPSSLKCPAHVIVPFQAVFYSYPTSSVARTIADDAPSPYVGTVDLASNLKLVQLSSKRSLVSKLDVPTSSRDADPTAPENTSIGKALARDAMKQKPRSSSPKISIGGAYRVPQQGQVQIVIKNPNKTAVKLFLVPYDLEGMEIGTKTFVRQKSYSSGPIIEGALGSIRTDTIISDPLKDKSILRYLIHLNFCCPAKNRYYLYGNIRVVFANRVPDGKERLRHEVQLPEPKYGPYRPVKPTQASSRWSSTDFSPLTSRFDSSPADLNDLPTIGTPPVPSISEERSEISRAIPFHLAADDNDRFLSSAQPANLMEGTLNFSDLPTKPPTSPRLERTLSPVQGFLPSTSARSSPVPWGSSSTSSTTRSFSPAPIEAGSGLLSRQFRNLNGLADNSGTEPE